MLAILSREALSAQQEIFSRLIRSYSNLKQTRKLLKQRWNYVIFLYTFFSPDMLFVSRRKQSDGSYNASGTRILLDCNWQHYCISYSFWKRCKIGQEQSHINNIGSFERIVIRLVFATGCQCDFSFSNYSLVVSFEQKLLR